MKPGRTDEEYATLRKYADAVLTAYGENKLPPGALKDLELAPNWFERMFRKKYQEAVKMHKRAQQVNQEPKKFFGFVYRMARNLIPIASKRSLVAQRGEEEVQPSQHSSLFAESSQPPEELKNIFKQDKANLKSLMKPGRTDEEYARLRKYADAVLTAYGENKLPPGALKDLEFTSNWFERKFRKKYREAVKMHKRAQQANQEPKLNEAIDAAIAKLTGNYVKGYSFVVKESRGEVLTEETLEEKRRLFSKLDRLQLTRKWLETAGEKAPSLL